MNKIDRIIHTIFLILVGVLSLASLAHLTIDKGDHEMEKCVEGKQYVIAASIHREKGVWKGWLVCEYDGIKFDVNEASIFKRDLNDYLNWGIGNEVARIKHERKYEGQ